MADIQMIPKDKAGHWENTNWLWGVFGALVISAVVLITYKPSLEAGFFAEDFKLMDWPVRLNLWEYFANFFDPTVPAGWYRPVQGIQFGIEYALFGTSAPPYHLAQILFHLGNCLLLYGLVGHVTKKWQVGVASAVIYAGLPATSPGVFWVSVTDPFASFFYLLAIALWLRYLKDRDAWHYVLTLVIFVVALLSKELGVTLPIAFFLLDRWLVRNPVTIRQVIRRYSPIVLIMLIYGWYFVQRGRAYTAQQYAGPYAGLGFGPHIFSNLGYYLSALAFPWMQDASPILFGWMLVVAVFLAYFVIAKHNTGVAFVCAGGILAVLPVLPLPFSGSRYLYLPVMASAVLIALAFDLTIQALNRFRWLPLIAGLLVGLIVIADAASIAEAADNFTAYVRQWRSPVRSILQEHGEFPPDTYLYFVNNSIQRDFLSGIFSLRYGANAIVNGADIDVVADLRKYPLAYVYYFQDPNHVTEHPVEPSSTAATNLPVPVDFNVPIELQGYEVVSSTVKRDDSIVVLLYWKAKAKIDKSYTLFAHLVNAKGEMVAGADSDPRGGELPTNIWQPDKLVVDWSVIPVSEVPAGEYQLEIGWYYRPTSERLSVVTPDGKFLDRITINSFRVE